MPRLSVPFDKATILQMKAVMNDIGINTMSAFIQHCIKSALKSHQIEANNKIIPYAPTGHYELSKESIYNAKATHLPSENILLEKNNNSKKTPLTFLPTDWQPPTHLRHKFCMRYGLRYTDALDLFRDMAKENENRSRNWDSTWAIKVQKGVLKSVKPTDDDEYLKPEDTMAFLLAR